MAMYIEKVFVALPLSTNTSPNKFTSLLSEISFQKRYYQTGDYHMEEVIIKVTVSQDLAAGSQHYINILFSLNIFHSSKFLTS